MRKVPHANLHPKSVIELKKFDGCKIQLLKTKNSEYKVPQKSPKGNRYRRRNILNKYAVWGFFGANRVQHINLQLYRSYRDHAPPPITISGNRSVSPLVESLPIRALSFHNRSFVLTTSAICNCSSSTNTCYSIFNYSILSLMNITLDAISVQSPSTNETNWQQ